VEHLRRGDWVDRAQRCCKNKRRREERKHKWEFIDAIDDKCAAHEQEEHKRPVEVRQRAPPALTDTEQRNGHERGESSWIEYVPSHGGKQVLATLASTPTAAATAWGVAGPSTRPTIMRDSTAKEGRRVAVGRIG